MEGAWPALIDALVDAPPERRTALFVKALAAINGLWIGLVALYALGRWLFIGDLLSLGDGMFIAAYTLVPTLFFIPAYALWRSMDRRPKQETRVPLQLD